jgi:uncharacterized protein (DUF4415 family)
MEQSKTDWDRIDAMRDEEIDYSDIPDMGENEEFWANAELWLPKDWHLKMVVIDEDILEWFKSQGGEYQAKINEALRQYKEAHNSRYCLLIIYNESSLINPFRRNLPS